MSAKMWCIRELKPYFIVFFLFGHTSYIPLKHHNKQLKVLSNIVKSINFMIPFGNAMLTIYNRSHALKVIDFNSFIVKYSVMVNFSTAVSTLYTGLINPNLSRHICIFFANIIQYMEQNLQIAIHIDKFKTNLRRKVLLKLTFVIIATISRQTAQDIFVHVTDNILMTLSLLIIIVAAFHVILYVCLIEFLLALINSKLMQHLSSTVNSEQLSLIFFHLKWMYYNLWKISQILSRKFGFMLTVLILEYALTIVVTIYRFFIFWPNLAVASKLDASVFLIVSVI